MDRPGGLCPSSGIGARGRTRTGTALRPEDFKFAVLPRSHNDLAGHDSHGHVVNESEFGSQPNCRAAVRKE